MRGLGEDVSNGSAVLAVELLLDTGELSHSLFPVIELVFWAGISLVFLHLLSTFKSEGDLLAPLFEDSLKVVEHILVDCLGGVNVLGLVLPLLVVSLQLDVVSETLESLLELIGELIEDRLKLLLLLSLTDTPLLDVKPFNEWLVDLVDDGVQRCNGVLRNLSKQHFIVICVS